MQLLEAVRDYYLGLLIIGCFNFVAIVFVVLHLVFRYWHTTSRNFRNEAHLAENNYEDIIGYDDDSDSETVLFDKSGAAVKKRFKT